MTKKIGRHTAHIAKNFLDNQELDKNLRKESHLQSSLREISPSISL